MAHIITHTAGIECDGRQSVGACLAENDTGGLGLRRKRKKSASRQRSSKRCRPSGVRLFIWPITSTKSGRVSSGRHPATRNLVRMPCSFNKRAISTARLPPLRSQSMPINRSSHWRGRCARFCFAQAETSCAVCCTLTPAPQGRTLIFAGSVSWRAASAAQRDA